MTFEHSDDVEATGIISRQEAVGGDCQQSFARVPKSYPQGTPGSMGAARVHLRKNHHIPGLSCLLSRFEAAWCEVVPD